MASLEEQLALRRQLIFSKVTEKIGPSLIEDDVSLNNENVSNENLIIRVACFVYKKDGADRHWKDLLQALTDTNHPKERIVSNSENEQVSTRHLLNSHRIQFECIQFDPNDIQKGQLITKKMHVIFVGGGLGPQHASQLGGAGKREIIKFLEEGGGYIGCCAGAYLACTPYDASLSFWNFGLIDYQILDLDNWERGMGICQCENTVKGSEILVSNMNDAIRKVYYRNGPLFTPVTDEKLLQKYCVNKISNSQVLQTFKQEFSKRKDAPPVMIDTPSVISNQYGKGRVLVFSAHPEASDEQVRNEFKCAFVWASSQLLLY